MYSGVRKVFRPKEKKDDSLKSDITFQKILWQKLTVFMGELRI